MPDPISPTPSNGKLNSRSPSFSGVAEEPEEVLALPRLVPGVLPHSLLKTSSLENLAPKYKKLSFQIKINPFAFSFANDSKAGLLTARSPAGTDPSPLHYAQLLTVPAATPLALLSLQARQCLKLLTPDP